MPHFNGGLFEDDTALPLTADQLELLIEAARADWRDVEPAIFGTLLERALDPASGTSWARTYTPRAYVERLVLPTVIEPLRAEWESAQAAALLLADRASGRGAGRGPRVPRAAVPAPHPRPRLRHGQFPLRHPGAPEAAGRRGAGRAAQAGRRSRRRWSWRARSCDPHQFLGIEVNPRAAAIAELVLWIGYLQWHFRTRGDAAGLPSRSCATYTTSSAATRCWPGTAVEPLLDAEGRPVTRWDGRDDEDAPGHRRAGARRNRAHAGLALRQPRRRRGRRRISWWAIRRSSAPRLCDLLGDGYVDAIRQAYAGQVEDNADYVMYWWLFAAKLVIEDKSARLD